jgi:hypothetical protein
MYPQIVSKKFFVRHVDTVDFQKEAHQNQVEHWSGSSLLNLFSCIRIRINVQLCSDVLLYDKSTVSSPQCKLWSRTVDLVPAQSLIWHMSCKIFLTINLRWLHLRPTVFSTVYQIINNEYYLTHKKKDSISIYLRQIYPIVCHIQLRAENGLHWVSSWQMSNNCMPKYCPARFQP